MGSVEWETRHSEERLFGFLDENSSLMGGKMSGFQKATGENHDA